MSSAASLLPRCRQVETEPGLPPRGSFINKKNKTRGTEAQHQDQDTRLPWWLRGKEPTCQAGDLALIPGSERSPGEGNGSALQSSCLGNPMAGYSPQGGEKSDDVATKQQNQDTHVARQLQVTGLRSITLTHPQLGAGGAQVRGGRHLPAKRATAHVIHGPAVSASVDTS